MDPPRNHQPVESSFYESIDKKFIFDLDESITHQQIEKLNDGEQFRVFRIKPSADINALLHKIKEDPFRTAFTTASHLFVFVIETSEVLADYNLMIEAIESFDTGACNQLWITTHLHLREDTEQQLEQSANTLTEDDQIKSITKHLARSSIRKGMNSDLLDSPLHDQIVAKIHDGKTTQAMKVLNLFSLYEEFSKKMAKTWILKRDELTIDQGDNALTSVFKVHQRIALKNLFGPDLADIDVENDGWTNELIATVGMVHQPSAKNTHFVHKTFADFFVAQFIIDKLKLGELNPEDKTLMEKLFSQALTVRKHRQIRTFIDKGLEIEKNRGIPTTNCDEIAHNLIEEKKCVEILHKSVAEQHQFLFRFIFNCLNRSESIDGNMRFDTKESWKIYKLADIIIQNLKHPKTRTTMRNEIMTDEDRQKYDAINWKIDSQWRNVINSDSFNRNEYEEISYVLQEYFTNENLNSQLIKHKSKTGKNILFFMATHARDNLSDLFWEALREVFDSNKLKVFLFEVHEKGANALHLALSCNDGKFIKGFFQIIQSVLNFEQQKTFLKQCDNDGRNILYYAMENDHSVLSSLWICFKESLLENEFKLLLKDKSCHGQNVLQTMITGNYENFFKEFMSVLQEVFNDEKLKYYLSEKDDTFGRNILCLLAGSSYVTFFETVWITLQKVFNKNELKALLIDIDNKKFNVLLIALLRNDREFVRALFQIIQETLDREEMKSFLQKSNYFSSNILHCVTLNKSNLQVLTTLWTCFNETSLENVFKSLMNHKDSDEKNVLCAMIVGQNVAMIVELTTILPDVFTKEELKCYLIETKSIRGHNILSMMAQFSEKEFFEVFWKFLQEVLDGNELKALIHGKDSVGSNALHNAILCKNHCIIQALFDIIRELLSFEEQVKFVLMRTRNGFNILHVVISYETLNGNTLMTIWNCLKKSSMKDVLKTLMTHEIFEGSNLLAFLISKQNLTIARGLTTISPDAFTREELKRYLTETRNFHGQKILGMMAQFSNKEFFKVLWDFMQGVLDSNELKALVFDRNSEGSNALVRAILFNNDFMIQSLFDINRKLLSPEEQVKFLQLRTYDGSNILHIVNSYENVNGNTLMTLWKCFKESLLVDLFKSLMDYDIKCLIHIIVTNNETKSEEWKIIMREIQG